MAENFFEGKGGGDSRTRRIVNWLRERRLNVRVVALRPPEGTLFDPGDFVLYDLPNVKLHWFLQWLFATPLTYYKTRKALSGLGCWDDADIVWTVMERGAAIARFLAPNSTILYSPGEVYPGLLDYLRQEGVGRGRMTPFKQVIDWFWHRRMQRHAIAACSGIIATSNNTANQLTQEYRFTKPVLISHSPAPPVSPLTREERSTIRQEIRNHLTLAETDFVFVSAGRLTQRKGFDMLIDAFSRLETTNAHLVICGEGALAGSLSEYAEMLGVSNRVHFVGHVSPVFDYFLAADCFVSTATYEPLANVLLEALAAGLPVIGLSGPEGGIKTATEEVIRSEDYGIVVRGINVEGLASSMRAMGDLDPDKRAAMKIAAENAASTFFGANAVLSEQYAFGRALFESRRTAKGRNSD